MSTCRHSQTIQGNIQDLFFHDDPDARGLAAATLGESCMSIAHEREVIEALNTALHDPVATVQDAALQSLMRLEHKG